MITAGGAAIPPLRDADAINRLVLGHCLKDTVFASQARDWLLRNPGYEPLDFLWAVTKPARESGTLLTAANWQSYAAYILTLPPPPEPEPDPQAVLVAFVNRSPK